MLLRKGFGVLCLGAAALASIITFVACSDDESSGATSADAGPDRNPNPNPTTTTTVNPPPPNFPDAPPGPPDLVSRSGFMGNATQIADLGGEATDGPSWRPSDGALYFTVPSSATPLRRLVPGGSPTVVAVEAGTFSPVGTATGGGDKLYLTESTSIVTLDVDDAGVASNLSRTTGLGNTVFGDIALSAPNAYFVDTANPRVYRFVGPSTLSLESELADAGKTTAIATRDAGFGNLAVYVGAGGNKILLMSEVGGSLEVQDVFPTNGIPPNGIAVDEAGRIFVAWAKGIEVFTSQGTSTRPNDGEATLPIAAIPTSLTFGGADRKTLFVTTSKGKIYSIPVQSPGILR